MIYITGGIVFVYPPIHEKDPTMREMKQNTTG